MQKLEALIKLIPKHARTNEGKIPLLDVVTITRDQAARDASNDRKKRRKTTPLRRLLLQFTNDARHMRNMHDKTGAEREYYSADQISGEMRELTLLLTSQSLKESLERNLQTRVRRFMLSPHQIDRMRLFEEKGNVRQNIKRIPDYLMRAQRKPMQEVLVPLQHVDARGNVNPTPRRQRLSLVALDPETSNEKLLRSIFPRGMPKRMRAIRIRR